MVLRTNIQNLNHDNFTIFAICVKQTCSLLLGDLNYMTCVPKKIGPWWLSSKLLICLTATQVTMVETKVHYLQKAVLGICDVLVQIQTQIPVPSPESALFVFDLQDSK